MTHPLVTLTGLVGEERVFGIDDLAALASLVDDAGTVAAGAVGVAVRMDDVLATATVHPDATHCTVISQGGAYRASIPLPVLRSGGWLAFGLGGGQLPEEAGGPYRLTVSEGRTLCWNVKRVATLRLTAGAEPDDIPANPSH